MLCSCPPSSFSSVHLPSIASWCLQMLQPLATAQSPCSARLTPATSVLAAPSKHTPCSPVHWHATCSMLCSCPPSSSSSVHLPLLASWCLQMLQPLATAQSPCSALLTPATSVLAAPSEHTPCSPVHWHATCSMLCSCPPSSSSSVHLPSLASFYIQMLQPLATAQSSCSALLQPATSVLAAPSEHTPYSPVHWYATCSMLCSCPPSSSCSVHLPSLASWCLQ